MQENRENLNPEMDYIQGRNKHSCDKFMLQYFAF